MFVDDMDSEERRFYERTRLKVAWSIFVASVGLMALALCSVYAGEADSANIMSDTTTNKEMENSYNALSSGYGFASFMFIVAFLVFIAGAINISPHCCGSTKEKEIMNAARLKVIENAGDEEQGQHAASMAVGQTAAH